MSNFFGIWQPPAPGDFKPLQKFEKTLNRKFDVISWYQAWGGVHPEFRLNKVQWVHRHGAIPMITWEPWMPELGLHQQLYSLPSIINGFHEAYITRWAQEIKKVAPMPVLIRFAHEMNGSWYPWGVTSTAKEKTFKEAWRTIVRIFDRCETYNARFVWCPNKDFPGAYPLADLFPGEGYVHYVGIDGYNFGSETYNQKWRSFDETFHYTYEQLAKISYRNIMICEVGCAESGGDKAQWILDGLNFENLERLYPRLSHVVYFNEDGSGKWRLRKNSIEALKQVLGEWDDE